MQHKKLITSISIVCIILVFSISKLNSSQKLDKINSATTKPAPTPEFLYANVEQAPDHGKVILLVGETKMTVEVVKTSESITQGLSGRNKIGANGMLFVFSQSMVPRFWMKEMKFPLDMIWINEGIIVDITENAPAPDPTLPLNELPTFAPKAPANWVLEVPAGTAKTKEIKTGDKVTTILQ